MPSIITSGSLPPVKEWLPRTRTDESIASGFVFEPTVTPAV